MKRILSLLTLMGFLSVNIFGQAIPKQINYQGVLKDASGNLINGDQAITFKIYNEPTGGTALWTEIQVISVTDGLFSAHLGSVTSIAGVPFNRDHFLGITIGTGAELTPRTMLTPSPYSFMSMDVMDEAITTAKIHDGAVTGDKIGSSQVVKSLNGIKDDVTLVAGTNITLTPSGNNLTINAAGGGGGTVTQVNTGAGLTGGPITTTGTISIPNDGITSAMLQSNSVTSAKIVDGAVATADLGDNSVTSAKIIDATITGPDIANNTIGLEKLNFIPGTGTIGGSGTAGYIPRFSDSNTLTNSNIIYDSPLGSGGYIGISASGQEFSSKFFVRYNYALGVTPPTYISRFQTRSESFPFENTDLAYIKMTSGDAYFKGSVGIGVTSPTAQLHVKHNANDTYGRVATTLDGVNGYTNVSSGYAIYGVKGASASFAGYFSGAVHVAGALSKSSGSFKIDHPLDPANKYLYHSFVESPDMMNIYNGNVVTDGSGYANIQLPEWFEALNKDFRYQLTVIGDFAQAIIAQKVQGNQFAIRTDKPNIEVSWQVTGIRKDAYAEKNRIPIEESKKGHEVGRYIHPEVYGLPETLGIDYERNKLDRELPSE